MYIRFFEDPNGDVVESVEMHFDTIALQGLLSSLPSALVEVLEAMPEKSNDDPDLDEPRRRHINKCVNLANLLVDVTKVFTNKKFRTILSPRDINEDLLQAVYALRQFQKAKDIRIAEIHEKMGENWGTRTGFQTTNYNEDAERILAYIQES